MIGSNPAGRQRLAQAPMPMTYQVLLADGHTLIRQAVRRCLDTTFDVQVVGEVWNGLELLEVMNNSTPDLVILDISMPGLSGLEAVRQIIKRHPEVKILVLTMHNSAEYLHQALTAGVHGYLLKENALTDLNTAIQTIRRGENYISPFFTAEFSRFSSL